MIFQSIKMALKSINANKSRAFLTMLGIIIGVMALVVLVSLVTSATNSVSERIQSMGNDMITVNIRDDGGNPIKLNDVDKLAEADSVGLVAPVMQSSASVRKGTDSVDVSVTGTNNSYFGIEGSELLYGRFLMSPDLENNSCVTVLSYEAAKQIFGEAGIPAAVGSTITMSGIKYLVVGVLNKDDSMFSGMMQMYSVYIPVTVSQRLSQGGSNISSFYVAAKDADNIDNAEAYVRNSLLTHFKGNEDAFYIQNMNTLSSAMSDISSTFSLLLGGIAAISLLVGGIGIMNVMLVSVTERTREIGIRKAIGAKRRSILAQFLIEALALCLIGCLLGIIISGLILMLINSIASDSGFVFSFSGSVIAAAVIFSTLIGIVFGLYPAWKAAKLHPIEALRYE